MEYRTRHALQTWRVALWYSDKVTVQCISWNIISAQEFSTGNCRAEPGPSDLPDPKNNNCINFLYFLRRERCLRRGLHVAAYILLTFLLFNYWYVLQCTTEKKIETAMVVTKETSLPTKVTDFRRRFGSDLSAPEMREKNWGAGGWFFFGAFGGIYVGGCAPVG